MYTPGTIANSQGMRTKIKKWYYCQIKNFSGTSDTISHLKTFRIISNKMPVLLLILYWWYFSFLQMYLDKSFNIYFHVQMFFQIFVPNRDTDQFFREIVQFYKQWNFHEPTSMFVGGQGFNILILKYFSGEWEQFYEFSLKSKKPEGNSAAISFL